MTDRERAKMLSDAACRLVKRGWCQDSYYSDMRYDKCLTISEAMTMAKDSKLRGHLVCCALGAIKVAQRLVLNKGDRKPLDMLMDKLESMVDDHNMIQYNDSSHRRKSEVVALFEEASKQLSPN